MSERERPTESGSPLSEEVRQQWLKNYGMPDSTPDEDILLAIGSGFA